MDIIQFRKDLIRLIFKDNPNIEFDEYISCADNKKKIFYVVRVNYYNIYLDNGSHLKCMKTVTRKGKIFLPKSFQNIIPENIDPVTLKIIAFINYILNEKYYKKKEIFNIIMESYMRNKKRRKRLRTHWSTI